MKIVREADKYYTDILALIEKFYVESLSEYSVKQPSTAFLISSFANYKNNAFLLINDDDKCVGVLAGQRIEDVLNGEQIFQEVIWYVHPDYRKHGIMMLKEVEATLAKEGYKMVVMVCMHNSMAEKLTSFYEKTGYKPMETHFVKMLKGDQDG